MSDNRVVLYSNGIGDFQRSYTITGNQTRKISIPVRSDHLADVLASFNVYGDVTLQSPPTFRPSNELEGNLSINPQSVLEDLATNLSGAEVRIEWAGKTLEGKLVGIHREEEATAGKAIHPPSLVILNKAGLSKCPLREIQSFKFLDDDVQAEIDKSLQRNYQRIKPNSTFVDLELSASKENAEAIVQYTIPVAAWKISYRIRLTESKQTELQGFAIVDNNTDEDWNDFQVCVVTGEPITFSTDLAETKTPGRQHVNLVREMAFGAVEVEEAEMMMDDAVYSAAPEMVQAKMMASSPMRASRKMSGGNQADLSSAEMSSADVHEVGDYSLFESKSLVTIPARQSAIIPVFNLQIAETKSVLHYKFDNHPDRPFRSIDFTNETSFSLGRGVCTVYEHATYSGNCIIAAMKPAQNRLLPHALETGVSIKQEEKSIRRKVVSLHFAKGFCYTRMRHSCETVYHIKNSRENPYQLFLDHTTRIYESEIEARLLQQGSEVPKTIKDKLAGAVRYSLTLEPKSEIMLKVMEQSIDESEINLIPNPRNLENIRMDWLKQNIIRTNGPLAKDKNIQQCLKIHQSLETIHKQIAHAEGEIKKRISRQKRIRENIKAGGQDELTSRWRNDLDQLEKEIEKIEETEFPEFHNEQEKLNKELAKLIKSLAIEWTE